MNLGRTARSDHVLDGRPAPTHNTGMFTIAVAIEGSGVTVMEPTRFLYVPVAALIVVIFAAALCFVERRRPTSSSDRPVPYDWASETDR